MELQGKISKIWIISAAGYVFAGTIFWSSLTSSQNVQTPSRDDSGPSAVVAKARNDILNHQMDFSDGWKGEGEIVGLQEAGTLPVRNNH